MTAARFSKSLALFLACSLALPTTGFATSFPYDVSGPNGRRDEDGRPSYSPGDTAGWGGQDGNDGGHAREIVQGGRLNKKGWDGGKLNLTLASPDGRNVQIQGSKVLPEQSNKLSVADSIPLVSSSSLLLNANGGAGGGGGNGGRGQDGGKGTTGSSANQYMPGGSGGRGGTGGDEGDSTDGGDAGVGGEIVVRVPIQDTDLAMLIDRNSVEGNRGGPAGQGQGAGRVAKVAMVARPTNGTRPKRGWFRSPRARITRAAPMTTVTRSCRRGRELGPSRKPTKNHTTCQEVRMDPMVRLVELVRGACRMGATLNRDGLHSKLKINRET